MARRAILARLFVVGWVCAGVLGCPSRTASTRPTNRDAPPPVGPSGVAFKAAQDAQAQGRLPEALAIYQEILKQYPHSLQVPHALLAIGKLAPQLGDRETGRHALETLALNHPGHPLAKDAKLLMASMDLEEGRTQEGVSSMRSALAEVPAADRVVLSHKMGKAMFAAGQYPGALLPLATAEAGTPDGAERKELQEMLLQIVDNHLRFPEVLALREQLPAAHSHARNLLTMKLARIYLHLGEDARAVEEIKAYLLADPHGAFSTAAHDTLVALETRNTVAANRLGVVLPMSGKYAQTGERVLAALKLGLRQAVADAIAKGQVSPPPAPVEVVVQDDAGGPEDAAHALDTLLNEQRVMAAVGAITLPGSRSAALKAEAVKLPLLTLARKDGLAQVGPFTFQLALTDERQAREVARVAADELGFKRVALLYPRLPKGVALINAFWDEFESRGGAIAGVEGYDHDETTFSGPVKKLVGRHWLEARGEYIACARGVKELESAYKRQKGGEACKDSVSPVVDFEAIFIADYHKPAGLIAPALAAEDVFVGNDERALRQFKQTTGAAKVRQVMLLGTNGFNDKSLPGRGGKYVQGAIFVDGFNPNDGRPETLAFIQAFGDATSGLKPELRDAQAFDAGRMLGMVFASGPKSRTEFKDKLGALKDFPGLCGPTAADAQGNLVAPLQVFTIKGDAIVPAHLESKTGG